MYLLTSLSLRSWAQARHVVECPHGLSFASTALSKQTIHLIDEKAWSSTMAWEAFTGTKAEEEAWDVGFFLSLDDGAGTQIFL